jgi:hypothetical protein
MTIKIKIRIKIRATTPKSGMNSELPAETICAKSARGYVSFMDWQPIATWAVSAGTAGIFLARAWPRRRKFSFQRETHCGCGGAGDSGRQSVVFRARKGQRAQVIVKMK